MTYLVSAKCQVIISREIRERLGVKPGWVALQRLVVRHLTGDPDDLAERASQIIDKEDGLQVCDVVIAETAYVLISVYKVHRESVVDTLVRFFQKENIRPFALEKDMLLHALLICRSSGRVSFADALVCATAQSTEEKVVYSLDECFSQESVEVRMGNNPET